MQNQEMNDQALTKANLIDLVCKDTGMQKKDATLAINSMLSQLEQHLGQGHRVSISGFGTFEVRERQAREGVKPGTTEKIQIPASKYPAFKPGKSLKERVNQLHG